MQIIETFKDYVLFEHKGRMAIIKKGEETTPIVPLDSLYFNDEVNKVFERLKGGEDEILDM